MFGAQSMRLLRTRWKNATVLAEELFAMLQDDIPLTHKAPLTLQMPDGSFAPALTIRNSNWNDPSNNTPLIKFEDNAGNSTGGLDKFGDLVNPDGSKKTTDAGSKQQSGSSGVDFEVFACQVVGGSGNSYQCQLSKDDGSTFIMEAGIPKLFTVRQLKIAPGAAIPVGTWDLAMKRGGKYFMQCPVWL
jgi:hypothetical protein